MAPREVKAFFFKVKQRQTKYASRSEKSKDQKKYDFDFFRRKNNTFQEK